MALPTITCSASKYRVICPLTLEKKERDSKMEEFIKSQKKNKHVLSPIKGLLVVDMQPIDYKKQGVVYYGINYVLINFIKLMRDFKKTVSYSFYITFVDDNGLNANYCNIIKQYIPYHYYFNSITITLKPI